MWMVVSFLNDVVGINEVKLKKLSYELITYRDDIRNILSKYSDIIKKTELYFNGDVATEFRRRFNDFSNNFLVVNNTFLNYSNDMLSLIDSYVHEENSTIMVDKWFSESEVKKDGYKKYDISYESNNYWL